MNCHATHEQRRYTDAVWGRLPPTTPARQPDAGAKTNSSWSSSPAFQNHPGLPVYNIEGTRFQRTHDTQGIVARQSDCRSTPEPENGSFL